MRWIKENPTLAAGIGLPIALVILFSLASAIPKLFVDPPTYDVLFSANSYSNRVGCDLRFNVVHGKLKAELRKPENNYSNNAPSLYLYTSKTGAVRQLAVMPSCSTVSDWQEFKVTEASTLQLDTNTTAPDGYTFSNTNYRSGGELTGLFFNHRYRDGGAVIEKNGRTIKIRMPSEQPHHYFYDTHFLGWIKPE